MSHVQWFGETAKMGPEDISDFLGVPAAYFTSGLAAAGGGPVVARATPRAS